MRRHRLSRTQVFGLARGDSDVSTLRELRAAALSKSVQLVWFLMNNAWCGLHRHPASEILMAAQRAAPDIVADLLAEPWSCAWAARCVRAAIAPDGHHRDLSYFSGLATVAALRAGLDVDLPLPIHDGLVHLPSVGAIVAHSNKPVLARVRDHTAMIQVGTRTTTVHADASTGDPRVLARRYLTVSHDPLTLRVALDDLDPNRDCYGLTVAERVGDDAAQTWRGVLAAAWEMLGTHFPERARELADALRSLVPLAHTAGEPGLSATSRDAFGAFALTRPAGGAELAVTMVHEFQHVKLNGLLHLVDLYGPPSEATYRVPWRPDPRPIGAALHGTYAFLGVAETWRRLASVPELTERAVLQLAQTREQVGVAIDNLLRSTELTDAGYRFVSGMQEARDSLMTNSRRTPATA
jgi:HEXXH motif-containing protein